MKTIGIFTNNESTALKVATNIINDYKKIGVTVTKQIRTNFNLYIEFSDGTNVKWIKPNLNSRGQKVTDGYIDISTCSLEAISTIIQPSVINLKNDPEIIIIDPNSDYKDYDLDTLIDRLEKIRYIKGNITDIGWYDDDYGWQTIKGVNISSDNSLSFAAPV